MHAPPTRACGASLFRGTCSPSAAEIASWLRFDAQRGAAELRVVTAAETRGELADDGALSETITCVYVGPSVIPSARRAFRAPSIAFAICGVGCATATSARARRRTRAARPGGGR
jgi:hypothetical protein